jgi:hypothetical protein
MLAHFVGSQDLPTDRLIHHPGRRVHSLTGQVAVVLADPPCVNPDAHLDDPLRVGRVVLAQRALDSGAGTDCCHSGREGDEEPVTQRLAHSATECGDLVVHNRCLQRQDVVGAYITPHSPQGGGADDVSHHDRELFGCAAAIRQERPSWCWLP